MIKFAEKIFAHKQLFMNSGTLISEFYAPKNVYLTVPPPFFGNALGTNANGG